MNTNEEIFGIKQFSEEKMREYLPYPVFRKWKASVLNEESMDRESADAIAHAMKVWAMQNGATHYSHWFHPMNGTSAEKHVAFLEPDHDGRTISRFSGKNLIKGETDGSSFPNGGLRQTFEARGYTYWDVTSPAFIKGHVLFIPSVFIAFHGESLDEKAPLLKAMDTLNKQATRTIHALGDKTVNHVKPMVGLEQEYFLIEKKYVDNRDDLLLTGRTLFGEDIIPNQEELGHYFGAIPSDVIHFMEDVNHELWKLGIYSKVEHNEVSPRQFEVVVVYSDANVAIDQNMLVMQTLERVALKHDYAALMHEKPFSIINGSGKHNNFSLVTDTGLNLFDPGERPHENIRFLIFVAALIRAVDRHATLLRFSASAPGNDYRLGASEAPPAIISLFVGDVLNDIFAQLEQSKTLSFTKDIQAFTPLARLSASPRDNSDRNRTSPFAFTGNKFEFRMPGSSMCSAFVNTVLCASMAETLSEIADRLEPIKYVQDVRDEALEVIRQIVQDHKRILFDGDGYHQDWIEEAKRRGLPNIQVAVDAAEALLDPQSIELFAKTEVFTETELKARHDIARHQYMEKRRLEAQVLIKMVHSQLIPSALKDLDSRQSLLSKNIQPDFVQKVCKTLSETITTLYTEIESLEKSVGIAKSVEDFKHIQETMNDITNICNSLEKQMTQHHYPFPTYSDMLFK